MKTTTLFGLALVALLTGGCWQKSLHPFYTTQDLASDEKLVGTWKDVDQEEDKKNRWIFTTAGKGYDLDIRDEEDKSYRYTAHLFKFEQQRFLDFVPRDRQVSGIPAHHLFRIDELGSTLKMSPLNPEFIAEWLKKNPAALQHMRVPDPDNPDDRDKDEYILLADTKALQKFVREQLKEPKLFADPTTLKRVTK
jgi:hypothetical protein